MMASRHSEASGTNESTDNSSSLTPNRRSPVWEYFQPELIEVDGVLKAVCKYCGMKMTAGKKSGTNSLRNHIAESCSKIPVEDRNKFVATMKKKPLEGSFTFNPQRSRELMITWCIRAEVAFNKFDDPSFEQWMESLQPAFSCVRRQTIRNDCVSMFERQKSELRAELQSIDFMDVDICKYLAKDWMLKYFRKYEERVRRYDPDTSPQERMPRTSLVNRSPVLQVGKRKIHREFVQFKSQKRGSRAERSELDAYLEEESVREDENFEILTWWKTNSNKDPVLSLMAHDFLAIPLSTVSSESAFSLGGRILGDHRSSMTPQTLEALVCCNDWLYKYPSNEGGS